MKDKVFQKDFYCVYNDYNVSLRTTELNLLYLPLVGSDAVKLYQFLGSKIYQRIIYIMIFLII